MKDTVHQAFRLFFIVMTVVLLISVPQETWAESTTGKPIAKLSVSDSTPDRNEEITFNASSSEDDGEITEYFFDFGDGEDSGWGNTSTITHSYGKSKEYAARVKVKDDSGIESNWSEEVTIDVQEEDVPFEPKVALAAVLIITMVITAGGLMIVLNAPEGPDEPSPSPETPPASSAGCGEGKDEDISTSSLESEQDTKSKESASQPSLEFEEIKELEGFSED